MSENQVPAQLWIGSMAKLKQKAVRYVPKFFCMTGCATCANCSLIAQEQFYAVRWLRPEKQWYTLDDLEDIFYTSSFALGAQHKFFFILESADKLSASCANHLLKIIEEPPPGYFFLLLAARRDLVMPTISSRCLLYDNEVAEVEAEISSFSALFTRVTPVTAGMFDQAYGLAAIHDRDPLDILDILLAHWIKTYQAALVHGDQQKIDDAECVLNELAAAYEHLPMPGSHKLFWRNLFLQLHGA